MRAASAAEHQSFAVCLLTDQKDDFDWSSTRMEGPTTCTLGDLNYTAPEGLAVQGMDVEHNT